MKKKNMETKENITENQEGAVEAEAAETTETEAKRTIEEVEKLLAEEQKKSIEYLDAAQRAQADFRNLKRRSENERATVTEEVREKLIKKILPIVDDFERAMLTVPEEVKGSAWLTGISLVEKKFKTFLEQERVSEVPAQDQEFNPHLHEAVQVDEDSNGEKEYVAAVFQKGYKMGDKVIRPAVVKVIKR